MKNTKKGEKSWMVTEEVMTVNMQVQNILLVYVSGSERHLEAQLLSDV